MFSQYHKENRENGFTLVELAIVLVVIGLLIGGILKGQELILNARITSTAAQINALQSAYATFIGVYKAKPGDFSAATLKIKDCNATVGCASGNGDGYITHPASAGSAGSFEASGIHVALTTETGVPGERFQALKHLALADMINGVDPTATGATVADGFIQSELDGFIFIGEFGGARSRGRSQIPQGIIARQVPNLGIVRDFGSGILPSTVFRLDSKIDDGGAMSGTLRMVGSTTDCYDGIDYNYSGNEAVCNFSMKIY